MREREREKDAPRYISLGGESREDSSGAPCRLEGKGKRKISLATDSNDLTVQKRPVLRVPFQEKIRHLRESVNPAKYRVVACKYLTKLSIYVRICI